MIDIVLQQLSDNHQFTLQQVTEIYVEKIVGSGFAIAPLRKLEQACYLEKAIFPLTEHNKESAMSMIALLNMKHLEQINIWEMDVNRHLLSVFDFVTDSPQEVLSLEEKVQQITFLMQLYAHPEETTISKCPNAESRQDSKLLFLDHSLNKFIKHHFLKFPSMAQSYIEVAKVKGIQKTKEYSFLDCLIMDFKNTVLNYPIESAIEQEFQSNAPQNKFRDLVQHVEPHVQDLEEFKLLYRRCSKGQMRVLKYAERFVDFLTLLLSSIPTRKYLKLYLLSHNIVPMLKVTVLLQHSSVLGTLVDLLEHYLTYPLNDITGNPQSYESQIMVHKDFLKQAQGVLFRMFSFMLQQRELEEFQFMKDLKMDEARELFRSLSLPFPFELPQSLYAPGKKFVDFMIESLKIACPEPVVESQILTTPLIPAEDLIWDYKRIPEEHPTGLMKQVLAIPKLNLQFLSEEDYLERNYWLYKLESAYDLRKDIEDAIVRMAPSFDQIGCFTHFEGWARMATEVKKFKIHHVQPPNIGRSQPKSVIAELQFSVERMALPIKKEWDSLKCHDVVFMVSFYSTERETTFMESIREQESLIAEIEENRGCKQFCHKYGIRAIRGGTIDLIYDERRREIQEWEQQAQEGQKYQGTLRVLNLYMDTAQYQEDLDSQVGAEGEIYGNFKLLIRRKPKENNFKSVLGAIHDIIEEKPIIPQFLKEVLLGYGNDEKANSFKEMQRNPLSLSYTLLDTFVNEQHFQECFIQNPNIPSELKGVVNFDEKLEKKNQVRFTVEQSTAIVSSLYPGLNMIVGPPGTGKTDVTVQIANLLYHNFANERTLIITHSNDALNDIFEKISKLDIDEKHLLRLGMGEKDLKLSKSYSKNGRINYMLEKRINLLQTIGLLQRSMKIQFAQEFTCQTASIFYNAYVVPAQNKFNSNSEAETPFKNFMETNPHLFETEKDAFKVIQDLFHQIEECYALEILRNKRERVSNCCDDINPCCTQKEGNTAPPPIIYYQQNFIELGLRFENIILEEAGQILEIEAFLPMTISQHLKRVVMIGDHNQLPPIVKNVSFQKSANLEQSFFIRMLRLGVHSHKLNHQGRMRLELVPLYEWKYGKLETLPSCLPQEHSLFGYANAGFSKVFQFVDVDYQGSTETRPAPYIFQNLAEAELIVATYMYMVLHGYDPKRISILAAYNGQKLLIRDIIQRKCAWHSLFQSPAKITTVDKYQGQQNDYILLSMVRTESIGYLRDNRRIIVALSRAKLGLYVFGKYSIFSQIPESVQSFKNFKREPLKLMPRERFPSIRKHDDEGNNLVEVNQANHLYEIVKELLNTQSKQG